MFTPFIHRRPNRFQHAARFLVSGQRQRSEHRLFRRFRRMLACQGTQRMSRTYFEENVPGILHQLRDTVREAYRASYMAGPIFGRLGLFCCDPLRCDI